MLIQDTRNDLCIDNDHQTQTFILNKVRITDSINLFDILVKLIAQLILFTNFVVLFSYKKRYKRLLSRIDHANIIALILLYDKRYAKTALYDRLQPYHNYAKKFSFYSSFQRNPLKIAA